MVASILLRFLKFRNLIIATVVGGGYSLNKKYESWKENLPDFIGPLKNFSSSFDFEDLKLKYRNNINEISNLYRHSSFPNLSIYRIEDWILKSLDDKDVQVDYLNGVSKSFFVSTNETSQNNSPPSAHKSSNFENSTSSNTTPDEVLLAQLRFQKQIEKLEKENQDLKKQLLLKKAMLKSSSNAKEKRFKKTLIDLYSEVLDELSSYDSTYIIQDNLPRVIVIGDQSSGKTSVLEMIAHARIFPRGSGEMMTRSPVMVTLSEGPYHVAKFKDSDREFDLTKESELEALRREIELRMINSVAEGKTISTETISLAVKGPRLQRMVLVDLPGIISTVTSEMSPDTKIAIKNLARAYMSNPNSIIMCIQDGSVDAERSNVTDLVSSIDPQGKRTIFVLTKVDLAEQNMFNPGRVKKILDGNLFPMKALGYFAVVTGKGNKNDSIDEIRDYENDFFKNSKLFQNGAFKPHQMTTYNMSMAVSDCFWKMVRESIEQQIDAFKATRFNLEAEWKNNYSRIRELNREELFEKARNEILDEIVNIGHVKAQEWEETIFQALWDRVKYDVLDSIYLETSCLNELNPGALNTLLDIKLKAWAENNLPQKSISAGWQSLQAQTKRFLNQSSNNLNQDNAFETLKRYVMSEAISSHEWDRKALESLRVIQHNALQDHSIHEKSQWNDAITFMEAVINERIIELKATLDKLQGPSTFDQWFSWSKKTREEQVRSALTNELKTLYDQQCAHSNHSKLHLDPEEVIIVRKNMQNRGFDDISYEFITDIWYFVHRLNFMKKALFTSTNCKKAFYHYQQGFSENLGIDGCGDVVLFWRVHKTLQSTANALRQQITNTEARRLEVEIKDTLDSVGDDGDTLKKLITGRRVELAEDLKKVRSILEKLEEFAATLHNDL